ncbi:MAG: hypothetical protein AAFW89_07965 [Bacteroidota bacterium]
MSGYSDVLYVTAAMLVFGIITTTTIRSFNFVDQRSSQGELEYLAISEAQNVIDQLQWVNEEEKFDSQDADYFFDSYPITSSTTLGSVGSDDFSQQFEIDGSSISIPSIGSVDRYLITVKVYASGSTAFPDTVTLQYIKNFLQ